MRYISVQIENMKISKLFLILALVSQFARANTISFTQMANESVEVVWAELKNYGIERWDAYHPLLPRPQVPAKFAVVNSQRRVLAYFDEEFNVGGSSYVFKATNGGMRHTVSFNWNEIQFVTPYMGNVAHANQFMTANGPGYNYLCRSQYVNFLGFKSCVTYNWINVIVRQLIRYN